MHFLFHIKKTEKSQLHHEKLTNKNVCAYPADHVEFFGSCNWELFVYSYKFEVKESISKAVEQDGDQLKLKIGIFSDKEKHAGMGEYFGDYLILKYNEGGNGELIRPTMSFIQCFVYEDNDSLILSSEIGLIASAKSTLSDVSFEDKYDQAFIKDSIYNEWRVREHPNTTVFNKICRVYPYQKLNFINSKINIDFNSPVFPRNTYFENIYTADKSKFYDLIFDSIVNFMTGLLENKSDLPVDLGLTGGLDSRCTLAFLREVSRRTSINIKTTTTGPAAHPDVVLAKQIANTLGIEHKHIVTAVDETGKHAHFIPRSVDDYQACFLLSQGDWSSNNFRISREVERGLVFTGQDNFKRINTAQVQGVNRWYARRMSHTQLIPVLANDAVNICASVYHHLGNKESIYEFVYFALKKFEPELLDIPFAGQSLPMHYVEPYMTVAESKSMPNMLAEAYYDEALILNNLPSLFYKDNFFQLFTYKLDRKLNISLFHKSKLWPISTLNTQGKKRIAMDFACSSQLNEFKTSV